jgi:LmbE family N-acetylglucosaminyl deacetylase
MLRLTLPPPPGTGIRLLAIGAHPDDIEIGAGGSILTLVRAGSLGSVRWVVLSGDNVRVEEARAGAEAFLEGGPPPDLTTASFRDGYFPYDGGAVKSFVAGLALEPPPDVILSPRRDDLHQDHRVVAELVWNTFRDHLILEYEIPKYDGDLGRPNLFVELSEAACADKIARLQAVFRSQAEKPWWTRETFMSLARLRGIECRSSSGLAEAFEARKVVLGG